MGSLMAVCDGCNLGIPHRPIWFRRKEGEDVFNFHGIQCLMEFCKGNGIPVDYDTFDKFEIKNMQIKPPAEIFGKEKLQRVMKW